MVASLASDENDVEGWECDLCYEFVPHEFPHGNTAALSKYGRSGAPIREHLKDVHGVSYARFDELCYLFTHKKIIMRELEEG
jgi:hypothetical protein